MDLTVIDTVRLFALIGLVGCVLALLDIGAAWAEEDRRAASYWTHKGPQA